MTRFLSSIQGLHRVAALSQHGDEEDFRDSFLFEDENGQLEEDEEEEVYEDGSFDDSEDL